MQIIGISGKAGSGKDWLGREVLRPRGYAQFSLSWHMKVVGVAAGWKYEAMFGAHKSEAAREYLQKGGTEQGREKHGENWWIDMADAWLRTLEEGGWPVDKVYVPDVRFRNEAEWVRAKGGLLVRMVHGAGRPYPLSGTAGADHRSETDLDDWEDWDAVVVNGRTMTVEGAEEQLTTQGVLPPDEYPSLLIIDEESKISPLTFQEMVDWVRGPTFGGEQLDLFGE